MFYFFIFRFYILLFLLFFFFFFFNDTATTEIYTLSLHDALPTLVRRGLPYLQPVWWDRTWTLYAVANPQPVISAPGQILARDAVSLTAFLPEPGEYVVRVRWSRYLSPSNGCVQPAEGGWSTVVVEHP